MGPERPREVPSGEPEGLELHELLSIRRVVQLHSGRRLLHREPRGSKYQIFEVFDAKNH